MSERGALALWQGRRVSTVGEAMEMARAALREQGVRRWVERHARDAVALHEVRVRTDVLMAQVVVWHPRMCGCGEVAGRGVMPPMPPPWPMRGRGARASG